MSLKEYTTQLIFYLNNPKFSKKLVKCTHTVEHNSNVCGDWVILQANIEDGLIRDLGYEQSGCSFNIAILEIYCDYLVGKQISEISQLSSTLISDKFPFPKQKIHCIELALDIFKKLI